MITIGQINFRFHLLFCFISLALVSLIYWPGLDAGFFLDDTTSIRDPLVMSSGGPSGIIDRYPMRAIGYLTFWVNYQWFGESPAAFRVVNVVIHWLATLFVYVFCRRILSIQSGDHKNDVWVAGFAAIIFLVHPVQTGAVTYIVQRLASLAALFSIMSLTAWLFLRTSTRGRLVRGSLLLGFICTLFLALNTKQNAFTVIPILILMEVLVLRGISLKNLYIAAGLAGLTASLTFVIMPEVAAALDSFTREAPLISRWDYFSSQWVVLFVYLQKLVWPAPLMLEYGYDMNSFSLFSRYLAGTAHLLIITVALWLGRRFPLVTFSILFFYIAHSIESGLIPIRDLAFEHRNYFPMLGVSLLLGLGLRTALLNLPSGRAQLLGLSVLICSLLSWTTFERNELWSNPEEFLKHDVEQSAGSARALHNLASWYQNNGQYDMALATMRALVRANEGGLSLTHTTTYISVLLNVGLYSDVLGLASKILERASNNYERAIMLRYMGTAFTGLADDEAAVDTFEEAMMTLQLDYDSGLAYGYSLIQLGRISDAFEHIKEMRQRFGDREKLALLAREGDRALRQRRVDGAQSGSDTGP